MINKEDNQLFLKNNLKNYDLIVIAGGDGTIDEVINIIVKQSYIPTLSIIPLGTCNDMANNLNMPRSIKHIMDVILKHHTSKYNVYKVNERYFIYGLACGLISDASYKALYKNKKYLGKLAYYIKALTNINESKYLDLNIYTDKYKINGIFSVMLCVNSRYLAGFKLRIKQTNNLKLILIKKSNRVFEIINLACVLLFGEKYKKDVIYIDASNILINSKEIIDINTDGEHMGSFNSLNISVIPNVLTIINNND